MCMVSTETFSKEKDKKGPGTANNLGTTWMRDN